MSMNRARNASMTEIAADAVRSRPVTAAAAAIVIAGAVTIAGAWFFQFGLGVAGALLVAEAGGFAGARALLPPEQFTWRYDAKDLLGALAPAFLLLLGDPNMYQRFFAARSYLGMSGSGT